MLSFNILTSCQSFGLAKKEMGKGSEFRFAEGKEDGATIYNKFQYQITRIL